MAERNLARKIRERNARRYRDYKSITYRIARVERGLSATERRDMYGTCKLTDDELDLEQDYV
jgi:hypothetical protein